MQVFAIARHASCQLKPLPSPHLPSLKAFLLKSEFLLMVSGNIWQIAGTQIGAGKRNYSMAPLELQMFISVFSH